MILCFSKTPLVKLICCATLLCNMLSFDQFKQSPMCKKLVFSAEDEPQDAREGLRLVREYERKQYDAYVAQLQPEEQSETEEEKRVTKQLTMLRNKNNGGKDVLHNKSRAEYFREYRKRPKKCPYCKKQI